MENEVKEQKNRSPKASQEITAVIQKSGQFGLGHCAHKWRD